MSAVTLCRHNPERCAAASQSSTAFSASGTLARTRANLAMLEYASTDARGEASAASGARSARKHLTDASKKARDRKSTRLNSSHQIISYAVFCLKKKTK